MLRLPPLRALQAFEAVARIGTVSGAANELGVTQGAVSQQLHRVEEALGVRLLERRGRNLELTTWGRLYHKKVASGFKHLRDAQEVLSTARLQSGLIVSCLPSPAIKWLGPRLLDWQIKHPDANIRLIGTESEPHLEDDEIDFRVTYGKKGKAFDNYSIMFTDWMVPACAPALLEKHPVADPPDVLSMPLLGIEWDSRHPSLPGWGDWAVKVGAPYHETMGQVSFSLSSGAIDAAVGGRGLVLAQMSMITEELASGRLVVPLDIRMKMPEPYILVWNRAALDKPHGPAFRAWMLAISRSQAALSAPPTDKHGGPDAPDI